MFSKQQILTIFKTKKKNKNQQLRTDFIKVLNKNFDNKQEIKEFLEELINLYDKEFILC